MLVTNSKDIESENVTSFFDHDNRPAGMHVAFMMRSHSGAISHRCVARVVALAHQALKSE